MILWMIVDERGYETIQNTDCYITRKEHFSNMSLSFDDSYQYMAEEMRKRIPNKGIASDYPIWAWYNYRENTNRRHKPDLRKTDHLPKGYKGYRLTIDIPQEKVLLSLFSEWHCVLNNVYLPKNEKDFDLFYKNAHSKLFTEEEINKTIRGSWSRIFDLDIDKREHDYMGYQRGKLPAIQATFWNLYKDEIINVESFTAR